MICVELTENGRARSVPLSAEQGRALARSDVVNAAPSRRAAGEWHVAPADMVGVARIGDVEVRIAPKLPIDRLLFLIGYARDPRNWRDDTVTLDVRERLVPATAQALWRHCERALARGPVQGYRPVAEVGPVLRGRLREADQLRRHHGMALPLEISYDDFGIDVPENQILLAALTRMLTVPGLDDQSRCRLGALRSRLADVTTLVGGMRLPMWRPTRLNAHYHAALRLAEIVWHATSPEHAPGSLAATGFLFKMPRVFEAFVARAFGAALGRLWPGRPVEQYRSHLDDARRVPIKPDLVWLRGGHAAAVIDAKYKTTTPNPDVYQMLAYCVGLRLGVGHLIYAKGAVEPVRHRIGGAGIEIVCHALDLESSPTELLAQVADLAAEIVAPRSAVA